MPMAARLHSEGRVLIAAGNQRASMMNIVPSKTEEKKGLAWETRKALEGVPTVGGGTATVCRAFPMLTNSY
jgi:hypothetical protein